MAPRKAAILTVPCFYWVVFILLFVKVISQVILDPGFCYSQLDVVQIQDMTSSFDDRWSSMAAQVGSVMKLIESTGPESSFGFVTFGDKNLSGFNRATNKTHELGYETDYCCHVDVSLGKPDAEMMAQLFQEYSANAEGGGADWPEAVFEAIYRTLIAEKLGWRHQTALGRRVSRVAVVVTDAVSHLNGDVKRLTGREVRPFDITASEMQRRDNDENYDCDKVDFPSLSDLADLVKRLDVNLILLVAPGGTIDESGHFTPSASLATHGVQYQKMDGLLNWYKDRLTEAGLSSVFVAELDQDMNVYAEAFTKALNDFDTYRCRPSTSESSTSMLKPSHTIFS